MAREKLTSVANTELLREFIKRSGMSLTNVANELCVTYVALNNKLKGKYEFTLAEALKIKKILNLTQDEWNAVFDED
jgi:plasmid maintenance system antidote protein VapI